MKIKEFIKANIFVSIAICVCLAMSCVTFLYSKTAALAELTFVLVLSVIAIVRYSDTVERKRESLRKLEASLAATDNEIRRLSAFPLPAVLFGSDGKIIWYNSAFDAVIDDFRESAGIYIDEYIGARDLFDGAEDLMPFEIDGGSKSYTVFPSILDAELAAAYFVDDTPLKLIRSKYNLSRPAVILINVDSLDQAEENLAHADYYSVLSDIDKMITKWFVQHGCISRKFSDGKFIAVTELKNLEDMIAGNFVLLDEVRNYRYGSEELDITLSIGIGREDSFALCEKSARQALDMARGRGGDQVAVKIGDNYEFFGGITGKKEKRGKVKSRVFAASLNDCLEKASSVYIMGHSYADFDCLGAAVGVAAIARSCNKNAHVVINRKTSLALPLVRMIENSSVDINFISAEKAAEAVNENSLIIITDTMRKNLVEAPQLLSLGLKTVIIDHHRMAVDHIENAALMFHEPYASSACEMVTELVQYAPSKPKLSRTEAQALLAGMILDTKNFSLRVGVRTFEAAAFLRDCKTDTVAVKKLFAGSVEENVNVSKIIAASKFYQNYAISVTDIKCNDLRLICSKAADELLNIENVDASFVISVADDVVNISARSFGKINVQLIMEALGGGGHQSMAACQLHGVNVGDAEKKLKEAINQYNEKIHKEGVNKK